jgi:predicted aspartyl protease
MKTKGKETMGRFKVDLELANSKDLVRAEDGNLAPDKVRRATIQGVVNSGAAHLVLPASVIEQFGLTATSKVKVRYADRRSATRDQVSGVHLQLLGRDAVFNAIVEPKRDTALIGAIVLEALDLLIDCTHQRLVPRDPKFVISEIE